MLAASAPGFAKKVLPDGGGADPEVEERIDEAKDELPKFEPSMATVRGSVFYNDRRIDGLFGDRRDLAGKPGVQCKKIAAKPDCSSISKRLADLREKREAQVAFIADFKGGSVAVLEEQLENIDADIALAEGDLAECTECGPNWLAGKYMVVDVIDHKCGKDVLASATVGYDGAFQATFPVIGACNAVELRARLKFCNASYCFSMNKTKGNPYVLAHPRRRRRTRSSSRAATTSGSRRCCSTRPGSGPAEQPVDRGQLLRVGRRRRPDPAQGEPDPVLPGRVRRAAVHLSVDRASRPTEKLRRAPRPHARRPRSRSRPSRASRGAARAASRAVDGKTPAHEYGHVMMQRAWGGSYGFDGAIGNSAGDDEKDTPQIAFKEAWAEFIARVVFAPTRGCHLAGFDANGVKLDCNAIAKRLAERAPRAIGRSRPSR